MMIYIQLA